MDILFLLIPLSVMLALLIGWCFWRAVDTGQFDDLDTPAVRILADDDAPDFARETKADPSGAPAGAGKASADADPATRPPRDLTQIKPPAARLFIIESIVTESKS